MKVEASKSLFNSQRLEYYIGHDLHERRFIGTQVRVIDGDTIVLSELRIRLQGIDSPELTQECRDKKSMKLYRS